MWRLVLKNIAVRKARAFLTIFGIVLGIFMFVTIVSVLFGLEGRVDEAFSQFDAISVTPRGMSSLPYAYVNEIESMPEVMVANPHVQVAFNRLNGKGLVQDFDSQVSGVYPTVEGYEPTRLARSPTFRYAETIVEGRFLEPGDTDAAIVGRAIADKYDIALGSSLEVEGFRFRVVGIYDTGSALSSSAVIIPLSTAQEMQGLEPDEVSRIWVDLRDKDDTFLVGKALRYNLSSVSIVIGEALRKNFSGVETAFKTAAFVVGGVAAVVGGIGVLNSMLTSVMERRREIGILKAVGWTRGEILRAFLFESTMMGFLGGVVGLIIAVVGLHIVGWLLPGFPYDVSPSVIVGAMSFATALGVLGGAYPAWRAASVNPIEALRHE